VLRDESCMRDPDINTQSVIFIPLRLTVTPHDNRDSRFSMPAHPLPMMTQGAGAQDSPLIIHSPKFSCLIFSCNMSTLAPDDSRTSFLTKIQLSLEATVRRVLTAESRGLDAHCVRVACLPSVPRRKQVHGPIGSTLSLAGLLHWLCSRSRERSTRPWAL